MGNSVFKIGSNVKIVSGNLVLCNEKSSEIKGMSCLNNYKAGYGDHPDGSEDLTGMKGILVDVIWEPLCDPERYCVQLENGHGIVCYDKGLEVV